MANRLPAATMASIHKLYASGRGIRAISRELGISTNTVKKHIPKGVVSKCGCGKTSGHKGWCKARYAESPARQAFQAGRKGVALAFARAPRKSRVTEAVKEKQRWLGLDGETYTPIDAREHYGAIGDVNEATKKVTRDIRDDVRSAMLVSVLDGRLPRQDIPRAVVTFIGYELRHSIGGTYGQIGYEDWLRGIDQIVSTSPAPRYMEGV